MKRFPLQPHRSTLPPLRRGAVLVESAVLLPVLLLALLALLDLGLAATRYNALSCASRWVAREAILHGSLAPAERGTWGPGEFTGTAADNSAMVHPAQRMLPTMPADQVTVRITWPDGDNTPRSRVEVQLRYVHTPLIPVLFAWGPLELQSTTTMTIVN